MINNDDFDLKGEKLMNFKPPKLPATKLKLLFYTVVLTTRKVTKMLFFMAHNLRSECQRLLSTVYMFNLLLLLTYVLAEPNLHSAEYYTGYTQKNGAVSKVNKKFISHLTRAQRTPSAAATLQVSHALPAVRFSRLLWGRGASLQDGVAAEKGFLCAPF